MVSSGNNYQQHIEKFIYNFEFDISNVVMYCNYNTDSLSHKTANEETEKSCLMLRGNEE